MPKRHVLCFKADLRTEWRDQDRKHGAYKRKHRVNLCDSLTSSTRIRFSVHTGLMGEDAMSILPFKSDEELVKFAEGFLDNRVEVLNKDVAICLTRTRGTHAYFPALIICIAFADLMSGLYAGTLKGQRVEPLRRYAAKFMKTEYTSDQRPLDILSKFLRNKIAHLAYPNPVFEMVTKPFQPKQRVTWTLNASKHRPAIKVIDYPVLKSLSKKTVKPWSVSYDCQIKVGVRNFHSDIVSSISKYLRHLKSDRNARERFARCMIEYFPR
jgi:hypothetical protein